MSRANVQKARCLGSCSTCSNEKAAVESLVCVPSKSGKSGRIGGLMLLPRGFLVLSRYGAGLKGT